MLNAHHHHHHDDQIDPSWGSDHVAGCDWFGVSNLLNSEKEEEESRMMSNTRVTIVVVNYQMQRHRILMVRL